MEHIPITESDDQKVYRIARELGIGLEDATVTCAGFELAFSDDGMRRAIFEIIDLLDESAAKKGEPLGLIINYTVELDSEGIRVGRYADEIPPGQVVSLTPTNRAMIFLRINDNFPTQQFLGPLIVNRPELSSSARRSTGQSCGQNEGRQTDVFCRADGVVCSDSEMKEPAIQLGPSSLGLPTQPICLGPIRLKFNERFPFVLTTKSSSQPAALQAENLAFPSKALNRPHHLPPWAALPAGMPAFQSSGLSPPLHTENLGHSKKNERCPTGPRQ